MLQLVLLDAVVGPVAQGRVGRVEVQVQRAQQRGRGLAAGRRRAAVGDGGVRSLNRRGVIERGHRYGRTHPRLCRDQRCTRSHSMCISHTAMPRHINKTNMSSSLYLFNAMSASKAIFMAKIIQTYKYNKCNQNQQTNKVIIHTIFYINICDPGAQKQS